MQKIEEIFATLIQTLTSEARVLNPNACVIQGPSPSGQCEQKKFPTKIPFFFANWINLWITFFQNFKIIHIYMKDAECAEMNEKSNFLFLNIFSLLDMVIFIPNIGQFFNDF